MMHKHETIGAWYTVQRQPIHIRKNLQIVIHHQQRDFYPRAEPGSPPVPACCTERRTIAKVAGELLTERDIMKTAAALSAAVAVLKSPHRAKVGAPPEKITPVKSPTPRPGLPFLGKGVKRRVEVVQPLELEETSEGLQIKG